MGCEQLPRGGCVPVIVLDPIRPEAEARWRSLAEPDEEVLLTAATDVQHDGQYGERWLVVTNKRVVVLPEDAPGVDGFVTLPIAAITGANAEPLVGGGRLQVEVDGHALPVLDYSSSLAAKFTEVARGLQQLAKGEPLAVSTDLPRLRCARCGTLLPEKNGLCPRCVRKLAVLLRIATYLKPYWPAAAVLAALTLGRALVQLAPPLINKIMIDDVLAPRRNFSLLIWLVVGWPACTWRPWG